MNLTILSLICKFTNRNHFVEHAMYYKAKDQKKHGGLAKKCSVRLFDMLNYLRRKENLKKLIC